MQGSLKQMTMSHLDGVFVRPEVEPHQQALLIDGYKSVIVAAYGYTGSHENSL